MSCISKILGIASDAICDCSHISSFEDRRGGRFDELRTLSRRRNGFYAFEFALHVFPSCGLCNQVTFERWNARETWKGEFTGAADEIWCFAEDVFGDQFAVLGDTVVLFHPETGETEELAKTVEEWACRVLTEYETLTGYPFAHDWQVRSGALREGQRLAPKIPFVLGGAYDIANLYAGDAVETMRFRGDVYRQIRNLPDGTRVILRIDR